MNETARLRRLTRLLTATVALLAIVVVALTTALLTAGPSVLEPAYGQLPPPGRGASEFFVELTGDGTAALLFERKGFTIECRGACMLGGRNLAEEEREWSWQAFEKAKPK